MEFKEEQKFTQLWLWILLGGIGMLPIYAIYKQLIVGEKSGNTSMSDFGLIFFSIVVFGIIGLFWFMRLKTEIDKDEIKIKFIPFLKKNVTWGEIKNAKIVNYGFVGGWGIRLWTKYGTVYNTKGQIGLAIELKNGKKFLIGTQKEFELKRVIDKIKLAGNTANHGKTP
ncbi:MAG TPA: hypothetical protein ENK46_06280 [Flavobacteriia bacterium]|nr:hypothetical protein [Flavobacteriia bacterium]